MFVFITISNGVAVVQHAPSGHIYRFRPLRSGAWDRLALDKVEPCGADGSAAEDLENGARLFAQEAAPAACRARPDDAPPPPHKDGMPFSLGRFRPSSPV